MASFVWLAWSAPLSLFAAEPAFQIPALTGPVVDAGQMLSPTAKARLEQFIRRVHEGGGPQMQVATVDNLGGLSIEEASIKITDQWKLGDAKTDRGVLLLLARQERKVRIEVGQGLEGDLTDLTTSRIIREVIIPRFKSGDIDRGVIDGVLAITHYVAPQFLDGQNKVPATSGARSGGVNWLGLLFFGLFILLPILTGRGSGLLGFLLGAGLGSRGGYGGRGGGGGWGGGGGGFSGGGSSGSW